MIYYEVNLEIANEIYENFLTWIEEHINELLTIDGFKKATLFADTASQSIHSRNVLIHYELDSMKHLDDYFSNYATMMREKTYHKFGDKIKAHRRTLKLLNTLNK